MIYIDQDTAINPQQIASVKKGAIPINNEWFVELRLANGRTSTRRFSEEQEAAQYFQEVINQIETDKQPIMDSNHMREIIAAAIRQAT